MNVKRSITPPVPTRMPGFYLTSIDAAFGIHGPIVWLGMDPLAGLRAFGVLGPGYYCIHLKHADAIEPVEWGTLVVWAPGKWRLQSREGRPVAVPGAVMWDAMRFPAAKALAEKGGLACKSHE